LDTPHLGWCHGDFQTEHVIVDPATDRVSAIIDWADQGSGDIAWDVAVLTIDNDAHLRIFLDGYDADDELRAAIDQLLPLYSVVRLTGEAGWFAEHGYPPGESLRRAITWRPETPGRRA
jgi:aminoglycoside phosphotransferase (APT) family kinase protein